MLLGLDLGRRPIYATGGTPRVLDVGVVAYTVRRSDRARRARLIVTAEGVELVVPRRMALAEAAELVREKRGWLASQRSRLRRAAAEHPPVRVDHGAQIPYLGEHLRLSVRVEPGRRRPFVRRTGDALTISVGSQAGDAVRETLERWFRERARAEITERLDAAAARAGTPYSRLAIRDQRTRWASCSANGTMSFNWRLLLAPAAVLDYVVEHEVAHLEVPDHSARFWALLARRLPSYRNAQRWLRDHGPSLRLE